jgi:uncharacterized protein YndB with AHSA1/START domain
LRTPAALVQDSIAIAAPPAVVWDLVTDVTRMPEWSPELFSVRWLSADARPRIGARFKGNNRNAGRRWSTSCTVIAAEAERRFTYRVTYLGLQVSDWSFDILPTAEGCQLTESTADRRGVLMTKLGPAATGVADRGARNLDGIRRTIAAIKSVAELHSVSG